MEMDTHAMINMLINDFTSRMNNKKSEWTIEKYTETLKNVYKI